jgi:hypothetical protein
MRKPKLKDEDVDYVPVSVVRKRKRDLQLEAKQSRVGKFRIGSICDPHLIKIIVEFTSLEDQLSLSCVNRIFNRAFRLGAVFRELQVWERVLYYRYLPRRKQPFWFLRRNMIESLKYSLVNEGFVDWNRLMFEVSAHGSLELYLYICRRYLDPGFIKYHQVQWYLWAVDFGNEEIRQYQHELFILEGMERRGTKWYMVV